MTEKEQRHQKIKRIVDFMYQSYIGGELRKEKIISYEGCIHHIDGNSYNNSLENLRLVSRSANIGIDEKA